MNYFLPNKAGAITAFKIGGYWRDQLRRDDQRDRRTRDRALPHQRRQRLRRARGSESTDVTRWCAANLNRDGDTIQKLTTCRRTLQDTLTHGRATFQLGLRYDYNHEKALGASIAASHPPEWLPAIPFARRRSEGAVHDLSAALGNDLRLMATARPSPMQTTRAISARSVPAASPGRSTR